MSLVSALPGLSSEAPDHVARHVLANSRLHEREFRLTWRSRRKSKRRFGPLAWSLLHESRNRLLRFRSYVRRPGSWFQPTWADDVDVRLALAWHVGFKEVPVSRNFSAGAMFGPEGKWMAASASLWEQALLSVSRALTILPNSWSASTPVRFVFTGGTLLALMRYGTVTWDSGEGHLDFVDKDIDVLVVADSALNWWKAVEALTTELERDGWAGCSLAMRESSILPHELEVSQLAGLDGTRLFSRGVAELVCALVGRDARTLRPAMVPLNAVWVQAFSFDELRGGRRWYRPVSFMSPSASVLTSSPACSQAQELCVLLARFPFQSWRGAIPMRAILPYSACAFLPEAQIARRILGLKDSFQNARVKLPCPRESLALLRWYDRGELWGRIGGRPCLALPLVVEHDRVTNNATARLHRHGISARATTMIRGRMQMLEQLGGISLLADLENCTLRGDGSYKVISSIFKGSSNHESDCPPRRLGNTIDWSSPRECPGRVAEYNEQRLPNTSYVWHPNGYQLHRSGARRLGPRRARRNRVAKEASKLVPLAA